VSGWRSGEIVEEAVRRLRPLHVLTGVTVAALCGLTVVAAAADLQRAADVVATRDRVGYTVWVVTVPDTETLSAAGCSDVAAVDQVAAAGAAYGENTTISAVWLPTRLDVSIVDLSPGAMRTWTRSDVAAGVFVGDELSAATGMPVGASLSTADGALTAAQRLDAAVVPGLLRSSVVRVVPATGVAPECWFRLDESAASAAADIAAVAFPDNLTFVARYSEIDDLSTDPVAVLTESPLRFAWLIAVAVVLLLVVLLGLSTRTEVGIYRATGSSRRDLATMANLQIVIIVLTGAPVGMLLATLGVWWFGTPLAGGDSLWFILQPGVATILSVLVLGPAVLVIASSGRVVDALRG